MTSPPIQASAAALHACLDQVAAGAIESLPSSDQAELLRSLTRAEARVAALKLRVLAAADSTDTAARSGAASTGQWAARLANSDQASSHRQVSLAQGLSERSATQSALAQGDLSVEHAAVIVRADHLLPATVTPEQRLAVEESLITKARQLSPSALRKAARRALAVIEPDPVVVDDHENTQVLNEEDAAWRRTRLVLHENSDGTTSGHFTIPSLHGQLLTKVLQAMTAPRRARLGAAQAQAGDREAVTDQARARGAAFCELLEHLPSDHLHPATAATIVVTMGVDALRDALRVAHLDTGDALSAGEARRLACNARLVPAVLNGRSVPLDLGRSARLFSDPQRTALAIKHRTCAADGCERPYSWCELHHHQSWSTGGPTDLANAQPLCHFHHQRIHDHRFRHRRQPDGTVTFHRLD